jgi:hypothetical protein
MEITIVEVSLNSQQNERMRSGVFSKSTEITSNRHQHLLPHFFCACPPSSLGSCLDLNLTNIVSRQTMQLRRMPVYVPTYSEVNPGLTLAVDRASLCRHATLVEWLVMLELVLDVLTPSSRQYHHGTLDHELSQSPSPAHFASS